jgi:hypothetical protein
MRIVSKAGSGYSMSLLLMNQGIRISEQERAETPTPPPTPPEGTAHIPQRHNPYYRQIKPVLPADS